MESVPLVQPIQPVWLGPRPKGYSKGSWWETWVWAACCCIGFCIFITSACISFQQCSVSFIFSSSTSRSSECDIAIIFIASFGLPGVRVWRVDSEFNPIEVWLEEVPTCERVIVVVTAKGFLHRIGAMHLVSCRAWNGHCGCSFCAAALALPSAGCSNRAALLWQILMWILLPGWRLPCNPCMAGMSIAAMWCSLFLGMLILRYWQSRPPFSFLNRCFLWRLSVVQVSILTLTSAKVCAPDVRRNMCLFRIDTPS